MENLSLIEISKIIESKTLIISLIDEENMSEDEEWELSENAAYTAEQNKKESEREKKEVTRESREDPLYNERVKNAHNSKQKHS